MYYYYDFNFILEITSYCALDCGFCPHYRRSDFGNIDFSTFKKAMEFYKFLGETVSIDLGGVGDPFLNKNIYSYIDYIFSINPDVTILLPTKLNAITKKDIQKIKEYNRKGYDITIPVTFIYFSKEKLDKFTGYNNYFEKFFKMFNEIIKNEINYSIEFVKVPDNDKDLKLFKKLMDKLNKEYNIQAAYNHGGSLPKYRHKKFFNEEEMKDYIRLREEDEVCENWFSKGFFVNFKGDVFPCGQMHFYKKYSLGNLHNINGDYDIFIKRKEKLKDNYHEVCKNCLLYYYDKKN